MPRDARDELIREQFTKRAPVYDNVSAWVRDPGMLEAIVARRAGPGDQVRLLDVCCGTGAVGGAFRGSAGWRIGVDLTHPMLQCARERLDACIQGSAETLPFAGGAFDLVVNRQALHFVASPERAAAEMFRVLRPGGQLLLTHRIPYGDVDAEWWERVNRAKQELATNFFVEGSVRELLTGAGFERIEVTDYFLWESIRCWMDSPEACEADEQVFSLYRDAPEAIRRVRGIEVSGDEIRDRWRWAIFSAWKRS